MPSGNEPRVDCYTHYNEGMTLRDYFAGQALSGLCASTLHDDAPTVKTLADWAYQQADAMIAARKSETP